MVIVARILRVCIVRTCWITVGQFTGIF
ncbi:hypothetical protein Nmel_008604 [Mimus melanotis]